jgi:hypothetical protein
MKHVLKLSLIAALIAHAIAPTGTAKGKSKFSVGLRQHVDHSEFDEYPFDDDMLAYGVAYEYHDEVAFWQLAVLYTEDVDAVTNAPGATVPTSEVDYILTPQLNLIFTEKHWRAGAGILGSYVVTDTDEDWIDPYWQFMAGVGFPVMAFTADLYAYYVYEDWGSLGDFAVDDIEFGGWLGYSF